MWFLSAYEKNGDRLVMQDQLWDVDVATLRSLWHRPDDDPMLDSYAVTTDAGELLVEHIHHPLHLDDYDYFVEYIAGDG